MKKIYISPETTIVSVAPHQMIAGSTGDTVFGSAFGTGDDADAGDYDVGESRSGSFWDDDEY